jgi:hypothetical protein
MIRRAWSFLLSPENRTALAWLGGGALAAAVAVLGAFLQAQRPPSAASGPASAHPNISAPGGVAAGTISGGSFTIGPPPPPSPKPDAPR